MRLITSTADLESFCEHIQESREASQNFITVDTEFQRERTYFPQLCLVQVATAHEIGIIDPLAENIDLQAFYKILQAPEILKVFHAGRQDIEIFNLLTHQLPFPIFDTQVAAMVCGFGESTGYETLVQHYVGKALDKSMQRADWSKRPLSDRQLSYAADDVIYLRRIYQAMRDYLSNTERTEWFREELEILQKPETFIADESQLWRRIKLKNPRPEMLVRLQALARERETLARLHNQPRSRLLEDEILVELAIIHPSSLDKIPPRLQTRLHRFSEATLNKWLMAMEEAMQQPPEEWPAFAPHKSYKTAPPQLLTFIDYFLNLRADQLRIVPRLLATKDDLAQLILKGENAAVRCLTGWRKEMFGDEALALIKGEIGLKAENRKVKTIPIHNP